MFHPGETVMLQGKMGMRSAAGKRADYSAVYVVMKQSSNTVSVAKLGGDDGKYLRVQPEAIQKVKIKMRDKV